jgi:hypothetical protein
MTAANCQTRFRRSDLGFFVGAISLFRLSDNAARATTLPWMFAHAAKVAQAAFWILLAEWGSALDGFLFALCDGLFLSWWICLLHNALSRVNLKTTE